jgi:hypothetical protein
MKRFWLIYLSVLLARERRKAIQNLLGIDGNLEAGKAVRE